uniref:GUN12 n=1 Tax=Arundo donax TaxID=35708 RepID=A0A0A9DY55_ARUDO
MFRLWSSSAAPSAAISNDPPQWFAEYMVATCRPAG